MSCELAEMRSRRRHPPSPAAAPLDDEDLLAEILLRLPPQPSTLPRASLVCKRWRGLVFDLGFFRRFRRHHRHNPPLLGFFKIDWGLRSPSFVPTLEAPNSIPAGRFSVQFDDDRFRLLNSRHGLVLALHIPRSQVLVWDPVTADQHQFSLPPGFAGGQVIHGAVLRVAADAQHFQVVLVVAEVDDPQHRRALACVYLSEMGAWGDIISTPVPPRVPASNHAGQVYLTKPAVLAENSLYWMLAAGLIGILEFDLERKSISVIQPPVDVFTEGGKYDAAVVRAAGGELGFLLVSKSECTAQLWKRTTDGDGVASWMLGRTIDLDKLLSLKSAEEKWHIWTLGFAEHNSVMVLWTAIGVFMIHLDSSQFKKLPDPSMISIYHPFESVYAAEACVSGGHDGDGLLGFC